MLKSQTALATKLSIASILLLLALFIWMPVNQASATASGPTQGSSTVCGAVTAYKPATDTEPGSITIGGLTFAIAPRVALAGVSISANLCLNICVDAQGRIVGTSSLPGPTSGSNFVCGFVTNFSPSLGGVRGSITIGGVTFQIAAGLRLTGQELVAPGAFVCLFPVTSGGLLTHGTLITQPPSGPLQFSAAAIVNGRLFGTDGETDQFLLPSPAIFTVAPPTPPGTTVFPVNTSTFGPFYPLEGTRIQGLMLSTPNSTVRALTCVDSFWDVSFAIGAAGVTEGDMVTFYLQNLDGTNSQTLAMFTIKAGTAEPTQIHPNVVYFHNGSLVSRRFAAPIATHAASAGLRTALLTLAISPSPAFPMSGCSQLVAEIKRGAGEGKTSLVIRDVQVKRMERPGDRDISLGAGLTTGALGWFPTGLVCDFVCSSCVAPPPPGGLSGKVFCDKNDDGIQQSDESGLGGVMITLTGSDGSVRTTHTDPSGAYSFPDLPAGTYKITETQPTGVTDGKDTVGTLGGVLSDDMVANIVLPPGGGGTGYNFAEICGQKCDTICWRTTQYFLTNFRHLPGGAILIPGVNANNPVGIQGNLNAIRIALQGGFSPMQRLSKEFVTAQLSLAGAGGTGSPVVFNTYWSPLRCSGVSFGQVTLSNGFTFTPNSLLNDLVDQTTLAIKNNRSEDFAALANLWALLNGRC